MQLSILPLVFLLSQVSVLVMAPNPPNPPTPPAAAPLIDVSPPILTVNPDQAHCPLNVKLKKRPNGPVSVFMQASNMGFSNCELKFDANNWDKPQVVNAIPLPYFTDSTVNREVEGCFKIAALKDPSMNKNELKYKIIRDKGKGAICQSNGDPHYIGFNGMRYDFLLCAGNYYLLRSNFLTLQTQTKKWVNHAHVNEALAIRFGKTVYILHADKGLSCASPTRDGVEVIESANKKDFHFKFADGSEVKAKISHASMNYIDITVELAGHAKGLVNGLCGKWDAANTQKFYGTDDKEVNLPPEEWGKKWAVPDNDNLFKCGATCAGTATGGYAVRPIHFCQIPAIGEAKIDPPYQPPPTGYAVSKPPAYGNAYKVPAPIIVQNPQPPKQATPEHKQRCNDICTKAIKHQLAEKYLDPKPYLSNCIADCCLAGTFEAVDSEKIGYFTKLRTMEKTLLSAAREAKAKLKTAIGASLKPACGVKVEAPSEHLKAQVKKLYDEVKLLRNTYGLGGAKCPGQSPCSSKGQCLTSGCMCKKGFTGIDCTISLAAGGYSVAGNVFTQTAYKPQPPKPLPPCSKAAKASANGVARALAGIPSVAQAIAQKQGY